ncbi:MAG: hypothetical protein IPJ85_18435 [Flavobacteriales bacterium]|nr:hypothetical protein [Flavobacteriales bacterium]
MRQRGGRSSFRQIAAQSITGTTTDATFFGNEPYCDEDSGPYQDKVARTVNAGARGQYSPWTLCPRI